MIITDIKKQVKDTERYSIYIDNKFVFGLSGVDVLYYRLKIGNEIPHEKYDEILENVIYEKAKNTAVKFLGYKIDKENTVAKDLGMYQLEMGLPVTYVLDKATVSAINLEIYNDMINNDRALTAGYLSLLS